MPDQRYDVFISYARDDEPDWVFRKLYESLLRCQNPHNRRADVFIDRVHLKSGEDWNERLANAIDKSKFFVPVFSKTYFQKPMCLQEWNWAMTKAGGQPGFVHPLLLEECELPLRARAIQVTSVLQDGWFDRLCESLALRPIREQLLLEFENHPAKIQVNETLPKLRVRIRDEQNSARVVDAEVMLTASTGTLHGTTAAKSENGVAEFEGLSIDTAAPSTQLIAASEGITQRLSNAFEVVSQGVDLAHVHSIPSSGRPFFMADGNAVALVTDHAIELYDAEARPLLAAGSVDLKTPPRLCRASDSVVAVADWLGNVDLVTSAGEASRHALAKPNHTMTLVTDVIVTGDQVWAALFSGEVQQISAHGGEPDEFRQDGGVQALDVTSSARYICDFRGQLHLYQGWERVRSVDLEPVIHGVKAFPHCVVGIGRDRLYQIALDLHSVVAEEHAPVSEITAAMIGPQFITIVDRDGKGLQIDSEFNIRSEFYTLRGAVPVSSDESGNYCVLKLTDGSFALLKRGRLASGRIAHTHDGPMSIDPSGSKLAVCDGQVTRLVTPSQLLSDRSR